MLEEKQILEQEGKRAVAQYKRIVGVRTGRTRRSIKYKVSVSGEKYKLEIEALEKLPFTVKGKDKRKKLNKITNEMVDRIVSRTADLLEKKTLNKIDGN